MKKIFGILLVVLVWGFIAPFSVNAVGQATIKELTQKLYIKTDSTIDVVETTVFNLNGEFHTFFTKYPLKNLEVQAICNADPTAQCASPDIFEITGVYDLDGNALDKNSYTIYDETDANGSVFKVFEYSFGGNGRVFTNGTFGITMDYTLFGAIGSDDKLGIDYIYMSNIPQYDIPSDKIIIENYFPEGFAFSEDLFRFYQPVEGTSVNYEHTYYPGERMVKIEIDSFLTNRDITYQIGFPKGLIDRPATIKFSDVSPSNLTMEFNGVLIDVSNGQEVNGVPTGEQSLKFTSYGYVDKTITITLETGEVRTLSINLEETFFTKSMRIVNYATNCIGLILMPLFVLLIFRHWRNNGRDTNKVKVVVPYYHPPENIRPYLLGTIKDENVDIIDITSTLIDVAYRGYIKIKELETTKILGFQIGNKDYELIKLKDFDDLSENEKTIMNGIFDFKEQVTISSLQNKFYTKIPSIKDGIYKEMKDAGYFNGRPDHVRRNYLLLAFAILVAGFCLFVLNGFIVSIFIYPLLFTPSLAIGLGGLALLIASPFMPARTSHGSKIYEQLLGFKMYMEVAEKFRMQDLTPETFEKYLPYAMVFGIEKKWGERFKDICKVSPKWFEGSTDIWSTIYLTNALYSFNSYTASAITSIPTNTGKGSMGWGSRGGGWSGGGGFGGGFSGGGIGGGRVGGFS